MTSFRTRLSLLVRLGRPKFLLYSAVLVTLGGALAVRAGRPLMPLCLLQALLLVWSAHLMTHYVNEYFDLEADRANTGATSWTGGSRVLVEGLLTPEAAMGAAVVLMLATVAQALVLPGLARAIAWLILTLCWGYTAPPFRLNYRGLGELTFATVLLGLVPLFTAQLQGLPTSECPWPLLVPAFLVQLVRMGVMNMADHDGDILVGKRTLVVRLGLARAARLHALGQALALVWLPIGWRWLGLPGHLALLVLATSPLGLWQVRRILRGASQDRRTADSVVFWATNHSALVMGATLLGVLLDVRASTAPPLAGDLLFLLIAPAIFLGVLVRRVAWELRARQPEKYLVELRATGSKEGVP